MNLRRFLKGRVVWERKTGGNDYEGLRYAEPVEIRAHKKQIARQVQGTGGTETRNVDEITVIEDVMIDDKIDGEIVQARTSMTDLRGRTKGYKLYTEPVQRS